MKTLLVTQEFEGYPDDTEASRRLFKEGELLDVGTDISAEYGDLIEAKGHAVDADKATAAHPVEHD